MGPIVPGAPPIGGPPPGPPLALPAPPSRMERAADCLTFFGKHLLVGSGFFVTTGILTRSQWALDEGFSYGVAAIALCIAGKGLEHLGNRL